MNIKLCIITLLALLAFAANSVLCRLALIEHAISPAYFTLIRLVSGAATLFVIFALFSNNQQNRMTKLFALKQFDSSKVVQPSNRHKHHSYLDLRRDKIVNILLYWVSPLSLFGYALCFSIAYIKLDTATGALILFASVQLTMLGFAFISGTRLKKQQIVGLTLSLGGFIWFFLPQANSPSLSSLIIMSLAGLFWGIYSLLGVDKSNPLQSTTRNFILSIPFSVIALASTYVLNSYSLQQNSLNAIILAICSGALASGIGYWLWYTALKQLSVMTASVSQLAVPIIATIGGALFVAESPSLSAIIAGTMTLLGILVVSLSNTANK